MLSFADAKTKPDRTTAAIAYGDLDFVQCDLNQNFDPINKKCCHQDCNPVSCTGPKIWQCNIILDDNCGTNGASGATRKQCQHGETSLSYFGGRHECA